MASGSPVRSSVLLAVGLSAAAVVFPCAIGPAFAQNDVLGIINGIIQRHQELAERRRQETAAFKRMQYALSELGYYDGPIDGDFGPQTAEALAAYRRSIGYPNSDPPSYKEIQEIETRADEQTATGRQPEPPSKPTEPPGRQLEPPSKRTEPPHEAASSSALIRADTGPGIDAKLSALAGWIVIGSRPTPEEAKLLAEQYVQSFPSTIVIRSANGSFAVTIGWLNREHGTPLKDSLISRSSIPSDSFLSSGEKFETPIWSVDGQRIKSKLDLLHYSLLRIGPASAMVAGFQQKVTGLPDPSTDYLSLRKAGSTSSKELRQLPEGTLLKVHQSKDGWQQVELLNGMTGWVSANYVGRVDQGPETVPESLDSGPVAKGPTEIVLRNRVIRDANTLLDNLSAYLSVHPETPEIASIAQNVSELKSALDSDDVRAMEAAEGTLNGQMKAVPGWADFVRSRAETTKQAEQQALSEADDLALKHQRFLHNQIAKNVASPNTAALATLLKKYDSALRSPVLSTLTDLNDELKKTVSDMSLEKEYEESMTEKEPDKPTAPKPDIVKTSKNRFLLEGELTD